MVNVVYFCQVADCYKKFYSLRALVSHLTLQHGENKRLNLRCSLDDCSFVYNTVETFRKHVRIWHAKHWEGLVEAAAVSDNVALESGSELEDSPCEVDANDVTDGDEVQFGTFLNNFAKHAALMRLKSTDSYMLPKLVGSSLFSDIDSLFSVYHQGTKDLIRSRLQLMGVSIDDDIILRQLFGDTSLYSIVTEKFSTDHLFSKYLSEQMSFCAAQPKCLGTNLNEHDQSDAMSAEDGSNSRSQFHYVSILKTLANYLQQPDVWASCSSSSRRKSDCLHNFRDGSNWEKYPQEEMFIQLHMYSDELELCNPIGSRKTVHKLSAVYYIVGNIETKYWSSLLNIHLASLCRYSLIKNNEHGFELMFAPLLAELRVLETEGIVVNIDGNSYRVRGTAVTFSGDNLTSHIVGGFNSCFSSGRVCRHCMIPKISLPTCFSEETCKLRTTADHAYHIAAVEEDKDLCAVYGVKGRSPFAVLTYFSPVEFFPPDAMHDVLEGVMVVNVQLVIKSLVRAKVLTIQQFNQRLRMFSFGAADIADKFAPLPADFVSKNKSLSGKAAEKWAIFRLLSMLIGDLIPEGNDVWQLHLLCREICEIVLAPAIDPDWIPYLEVLIAQHHQLLNTISPTSFTPKMHFLVHYPRLLLVYGPLRHLWVMRFEAMHQYFKQIVRRVRNFKNITLTLCERFQRKRCYEFAAGLYMLSAPKLDGVQKMLKVRDLPAGLRSVLSRQQAAVATDNVQSTSRIVIDGKRFRVGTFVVTDLVCSEEIPVFVQIMHIILLKGSWMICGIVFFSSSFSSHLHAYQVESSNVWKVFQATQLFDSQSLSAYNTNENSNQFISLRHRVCRH